MLKLGVWQTVKIQRITPIGAYVNDDEAAHDDILLPIRQVDKKAKAGDELRVFLYRDSDDRLITTINPVKILWHEVKRLEVIDVNSVGAFLDWGLEKDLFLPFQEQVSKVKTGDHVLVALVEDITRRLLATMKITPFLKTDSTYRLNDFVQGTIYALDDNNQGLVAVDDCYQGILSKSNDHNQLKLKQHVSGYVESITPEGVLVIKSRKHAYLVMDQDSILILEYLKAHDGFCELNDKSDPRRIVETFNLSKAAFKRAIGTLYKQKKITINPEGIRLANDAEAQ